MSLQRAKKDVQQGMQHLEMGFQGLISQNPQDNMLMHVQIPENL